MADIKTVNKKAITKAPSGLVVTRNGLTFTVSWKIGDKDYGAGVRVRYRTNNTKKGKYNTINVSANATSASITFNPSNYYPNTTTKLKFVTFYVAGKRNTSTVRSGNTETVTTYDWSGDTTKGFTINPPKKPSLTQALDDTLDFQTTFSWTTETRSNDHNPLTDTVVQSVLCKASESPVYKSSKRGWRRYERAANSSLTVNDADTDGFDSSQSWTRYTRVIARGIGGPSAWVQTSHVYAVPAAPKNLALSGVTVKNNTTECILTWAQASNSTNPVDYESIQYRIDNPLAGRAAPGDNSGWTDIVTTLDKKEAKARFTIPEVPDVNECLWVRVVATHDRRSSYSAAKLVSGSKLSDPTIDSFSGNNTTGIATITATNTAESDVPDSQIAVLYQKKNVSPYVCGIITHGQTSVDVQVPTWSSSDPASFSIYAFQGTATRQTRSDGRTSYNVVANMKSNTVTDGGAVPRGPSSVTVAQSTTPGEAIVRWSWDWRDANQAEVSWTQNPNGWESTDVPETFNVPNANGSLLRVSGLEMGTTWYFRVRLVSVSGDSYVYSPYSVTRSLNLSSAPNTPSLALSKSVICKGEAFSVSWTYDSTDGTAQATATIAEAAVNSSGVVTARTRIANATTGQNVTIRPNWSTGTQHYICVRVTGANGLSSDWSDAVPISVADPVTITIAQTSLISMQITEGGETRTVNALTAMPMTATITGAGDDGTTSLVIERAEGYRMDRPDEDVNNGFEGETVVALSQQGEAQFTINLDDLVGMFDDGAQYRMIATVVDSYGQSISDDSTEFEVHWDHQALVPSATVTMDGNAAIITPIAPEGVAEGDYCDIYRLSADKPELIIGGGSFGTAYVDPYPAIGEHGGHRVVFVTANGDYITQDSKAAWVDLGADDGDYLESQNAIIDFEGGQIELEYNIDTNNRWQKDFEETKYLGGAVQGDWNTAVSRMASVGAVVLSIFDPDKIALMRRLAAYPGVCHVRTPDGSSFSADVQVQETIDHNNRQTRATYSLSITRVDPEAPDGVPYTEWSEGND